MPNIPACHLLRICCYSYLIVHSMPLDFGLLVEQSSCITVGLRKLRQTFFAVFWHLIDQMINQLTGKIT